MIREAIGTLIRGNSLDMEEAAEVMEEIMSGKATYSLAVSSLMYQPIHR